MHYFFLETGEQGSILTPGGNTVPDTRGHHCVWHQGQHYVLTPDIRGQYCTGHKRTALCLTLGAALCPDTWHYGSALYRTPEKSTVLDTRRQHCVLTPGGSTVSWHQGAALCPDTKEQHFTLTFRGNTVSWRQGQPYNGHQGAARSVSCHQAAALWTDAKRQHYVLIPEGIKFVLWHQESSTTLTRARVCVKVNHPTSAFPPYCSCFQEGFTLEVSSTEPPVFGLESRLSGWCLYQFICRRCD